MVLLFLILLCFEVITQRKAVTAGWVPESIRYVFTRAHPTASDVRYTLNVDDSGISYLIDYKDGKERHTTELHLNEWFSFATGDALVMDEGEPDQSKKGLIQKTGL